MLDSLIQFFITYGYFAVFGVLLLCGFGLPIPEDIVLVAGGIISGLACDSSFSFAHSLKTCDEVHIMFAVAMAGVLIGDSSMYFAGRILGTSVVDKPFAKKIITEKRIEWVKKKFEHYGAFFVFAARFMPGLRSPIFIVAGITSKVSYIKFLLTDGLAALISVPFWVYLGYWGERQLNDMEVLEVYIKRSQLSLLIIIGVLIVSTAVVLYIKHKLKNKIKLISEEENHRDDAKHR